MEENNIFPKDPRNSNPGFVKKPIDTPILDASLRQQITPSSDRGALAGQGGGFKSFFKANKFYFFAIFAGLIIISVLAYFAFKKTPQVVPKEANVFITVDTPSTAASGAAAV
ncbi:MAG TPA: hypothetical protein VE973_00515, partial [Candidatus Limnocylindria bacterium]|nr:hypothetical protein [Candidatus Limnocylindria bacterium]